MCALEASVIRYFFINFRKICARQRVELICLPSSYSAASTISTSCSSFPLSISLLPRLHAVSFGIFDSRWKDCSRPFSPVRRLIYPENDVLHDNRLFIREYIETFDNRITKDNYKNFLSPISVKTFVVFSASLESIRRRFVYLWSSDRERTTHAHTHTRARKNTRKKEKIVVTAPAKYQTFLELHHRTVSH